MTKLENMKKLIKKIKYLELFINATLIILIIAIVLFWWGQRWNLTDGILAVTLWAILLYTWKTWQLKDLTSKQISFNIRPLVIFEPNGFTVKNIGKGIAKNIRIDKISVTDCEGNFEKNKLKTMYIGFEKTGCLENNGGKRSGIRIYGLDVHKKENSLETSLYNAIHGGSNSLWKFQMRIYYEDVEGMQYATYMEIKDGSFQVVKIA